MMLTKPTWIDRIKGWIGFHLIPSDWLNTSGWRKVIATELIATSWRNDDYDTWRHSASEKRG